MLTARLMKVALLSFFSFDQIKGGTELFSEHLKRAFPGMEIITYRDLHHSGLPKLDRLNLQQPRMGFSLSEHFRQMAERKDYDLVICNSTAGWGLSVRPPRMPMMNVFHYTSIGLSEGTLRGTPGYLPSRYMMPAFEKVAAMRKENIAVSAKVHRELAENYHVRSTIIENGVDLETFRPRPQAECREMLGIDHDGPLAIFVGRADHTKGFDLVCEIASRMDGMKVLCVTSTGVKGRNIIARQNVANDLMPIHYCAADLLLFPSRYESFGFAPLEAMACDVPVVASRTGLMEDLNDPRAGVVVPRYEAEEYMDAINRVLADRPHPRPLVGERYSLDRFARDYREAAMRAIEKHV
jgi:glycosyltransferase involved in cell wall biosynthesis